MEDRGYILIADITGYTAYLNESELEHAKETLTELLELLLENTRPPLVVAKLDGDAVFSYGLEEGFTSSQTFLEGIEDSYVAFRSAIELMVLNNTCQCNACANVSSLDLKFFVHHGTFVVQNVGDQQELMGSDVNLIFRLLKNNVADQTGIRAYMLCTDAAVRALGIDGNESTMIEHTETVPDFGQVRAWIKDMDAVWNERRNEKVIEFSRDETISTTETKVSLPPEVVWDYMGQSELRNVLTGSDNFELTDRTEGRIAPGTSYLCYHGSKQVSQLVLEWRPFQRMVLQQLLPLPGKPTYVHLDIQLSPVEGGTNLTVAAARPIGSMLKRWSSRWFLRMMERGAQGRLDSFRGAIEADYSTLKADRSRSSRLSADLVSAEAASSLDQQSDPEDDG